jgi:hypothetical protein
LKSNLNIKILALICATPTMSFAQDAWQIKSAVTAMTGHYVDSQTMYNQHGLGARLSGEKDQAWGITAGLQSTRIDMNPITQTTQQNQDNWLLSGFVHTPSTALLGRWTLQLDAHRVNNDASQSMSSDVHAVAPQITWLSYTEPLKVDVSFANSNYKNTATIHQFSPAIAYGFNGAKDWLQVRSYAISNLDPASALGQSSTHATDVKLTHIFSSHANWSPSSVTLGLERGKRIYVVDMTSQAVYNLPMLNEGGENIAANWKLSPKTDLTVQYSKTRYFSDAPTALSAHHFTLGVMSAQLATAW